MSHQNDSQPSRKRRRRRTRRGSGRNSASNASNATSSTRQADMEKLYALANSMEGRIELMKLSRQTHQGARDISEQLGRKENPEHLDFLAYWLRNPLARRGIDLPIKGTWPDQLPALDEGSTEDEPSEFSKAWRTLWKAIKLNASLPRADRLSALDSYSILFLGFNDQVPDTDEVQAGAELIYVKPFPAARAQIDKRDEDTGSPRFGLPTIYKIETGAGSGANKFTVHFSRVVHIANEGVYDDVMGTPAMIGFLDAVQDVEKVVGGSAEMFYQGADRALIIEAETGKAFTDEEKLKADALAFRHTMNRVLGLKDAKARTLPSVQPDPRGAFETILALISAATGIPQRILIGSERGQLASNQDAENFREVIKERRTEFAEPNIVRALIDRLVLVRALPQPNGEYEIDWPAVRDESQANEASLNESRAKILKDLYGDAVTDHIGDDTLFGIAMLDPEDVAPPDPLVMDDPTEDIEANDQFSEGRQLEVV